MTDKHTQADASHSNIEKDPDDSVTGDEPMTGAQKSYLTTLSDEAGEPVDYTLTKAQASVGIEELQRVTGRGRPSAEASTSESVAGEEDPGAADDEPEMRDAPSTRKHRRACGGLTGVGAADSALGVECRSLARRLHRQRTRNAP